LFLQALQTILALVLGISTIVVLSNRFRVPAFFSLLIASIIVAICLWLPAPVALQSMKTGFGQTLQSLGWLVIAGTGLGLFMEASGAARVLAQSILKLFGRKRASLSMAGTGYLVGLPVFCDAGFMVLNGLTPSIAKRSGTPIISLSLALASGLYIVHCLVPPHPGAAAAAATIGADFGKLTLLGMLVAIPPLLLVHAWARRAGQKWVTQPAQADKPSEEFLSRSLPGFWQAFLPILLPLLLIAARSILLNMGQNEGLWQILLIAGDPVPALFLGLGLAILFSRKQIDRRQIIQLLEKTIEKAGPIILVTGAGGAFGALLTQAQLGDQLMSVPGVSNWGLILPFLLAAVLKTAQGSSTVAMISAAGIVLPLLPALGLDTENGRILATLAMGAGSMMLSHANDSYFWVISRFANIPVSVMWRSFTVCSIILSTGSLLMILLLSLFFS
jgi:GntP family gluconate:H+ symporter